MHGVNPRSRRMPSNTALRFLLPALALSALSQANAQVVNVYTPGTKTVSGAEQSDPFAFDTWLRSVAPELHNDGVDVTSVYMGLIRTRMVEPTPTLRNVPGLSAEQAADIVAKAIIQRPATIEPWWAWPAEVSSALLRGPIDRAAQLWYRYTADSDTAQKAEQ